MTKVFICSPYKGDVEKNIMAAKIYCRNAIDAGYLPIAPHLYFTRFLNDENKDERRLGIELGLELMRECHEVWVCGDVISEGMRDEIEFATQIEIPIVLKRALMADNISESKI